ncbi:MAG: (2Fe-2S)-binding protein [Gammaproteobacteria bacterium]|nr:(2Fe-2S)-binding protein [Rhodocyclaceae bacterium]MBU3910220.1 (2Fe-2S)-binding protein [Gammaproteobacteria bacterium]MBU3988806.1 (2Fe-2S)-binding protein [Gammaproteobacteria bacterium]MBU4004481.1 (2Fe-2S)-binding protein [Gammaproteobacteria bacterium]MBU4022682.1 (2Fe-2S)-binding protein [Gammaproteobacteria bacterium]
MSACCEASSPSRKRDCPVSGRACAEVSANTITHHLRQAWRWDSTGQHYYFCDDPACDVVYFGEDNSVILKSQLRTTVGVKESSADALLCYCFGVTRAAAQSDLGAREFVVAQTKLGLCSCETSNPSGRCCLKDFPRRGGVE